MLKYYAGIGSRETPFEVLGLMRQVAIYLAQKEFICRTGGAIGADTSFVMGTLSGQGMLELYLPWDSYEGWAPCWKNKTPRIPKEASSRVIISSGPSLEALYHASQFHPAWAKCTQGAQKLHARNSEIILGKDLDDPVKFIVCWHKGTGGTMQGVRIAKAHSIEMLNLYENPMELGEILQWLEVRL